MSMGILHKKHQITTNISTCYPTTQSHDSRGYNKEQCYRLTTNGESLITHEKKIKCLFRYLK